MAYPHFVSRVSPGNMDGLIEGPAFKQAKDRLSQIASGPIDGSKSCGRIERKVRKLLGRLRSMMPFIIKAPAYAPDKSAVCAQETKRPAAIRTAISLVAEGRQGVTITEEDGEIYYPDQFSILFGKAVR